MALTGILSIEFFSPSTLLSEHKVAGASQTAAAVVSMRVIVKDAETGDAMPARCSITDCNYARRYPPPATCFFHLVDEGYFYTGGEFSVALPMGRTVLRVGRGFEYREEVQILEILSDTTIVVELARLCDMRSAGWFPGDVHVHIAHGTGYYTLDPQDAHFIATAEDIAVMNCLDNSYFFTGAPDPCSTGQCLIYMTEEKRSGVWGHYGLLGLQRLIAPFNDNWGWLMMDVADSAHAQSGTVVIAAHPLPTEDFGQILEWPGSGIARELPVDCAMGKVDGFEVMSYSNSFGRGIELGLWYEMLNCGFKLAACAGTDALMNQLTQNPPGAYRTYVKIPGGSLDYYEWLENLAAGKTFVTNGPLFTDFNVIGFAAGDSIFVMKGNFKVPVDFCVLSQWPLDRVEVVRNGVVAATVRPDGDPFRIERSVEIMMNESCWIAARAYGPNKGWLPVGDSLFAHTSPVYFNMASTRLVDCSSVQTAVSWIEDLLDIVSEREDWPNPADSFYAYSRLSLGKSLFACPGGVPCGDDPPSGGDPLREITVSVFPNPPSSGACIEFDPVAGPEIPGASTHDLRGAGIKAELSIYDISGRLVRTLFSGTIPAADRQRYYWDGRNDRGRDAASGIYLCRLKLEGIARGTAKILIVR